MMHTLVHSPSVPGCRTPGTVGVNTGGPSSVKSRPTSWLAIGCSTRGGAYRSCRTPRRWWMSSGSAAAIDAAASVVTLGSSGGSVEGLGGARMRALRCGSAGAVGASESGCRGEKRS